MRMRIANRIGTPTAIATTATKGISLSNPGEHPGPGTAPGEPWGDVAVDIS